MDQAAWRCDVCLASGLVKSRNCAWVGGVEAKPSLPAWARGKTVAFHCPKSIVTAQSQTFIEKFLYWKRCGGDLWALDAKSADALLALQEEIELEENDEEQQL